MYLRNGYGIPGTQASGSFGNGYTRNFRQGPVRISAIILAKAMGSKVIAVDAIDNRLESSKRLGANEIVNAGKVDAVATIQKMTKGEGVDATLDCTGVEAGRLNTLKSAKTWGRAGFVDLGPSITLDLSQLIIRKQLTVFGSQTFSTHVWAELGSFVVDHKVKLKETISDRFPLSEADAAYKKFAGGETVKAVFVWP